MAMPEVTNKIKDLLVEFVERFSVKEILDGILPNGIMAEVQAMYTAGLADFLNLPKHTQAEFISTLDGSCESAFHWIVGVICDASTELTHLCFGT
jgi:hypothetical protein